MQNAKDTFYLALRDRLAALNPQRQISLGGTLRPGILVEENETYKAEVPADVFVLRWSGAAVDSWLPAMLETQTCQIFYWTCGSATNLQMDRGRSLTEMDAELAAILQPAKAPKMTVNGANNTITNTNVFWLDPVYGVVKHERERLQRTAEVQVFSLQETQGDGSEEL
jgi:hypothetical protein